MIHVRVDTSEFNSQRRFACGIDPTLPPGDIYLFQCESGADCADCPGCNHGDPRQLGTPISQLATQPGVRGYDEFCRIVASWGHE